MQLSIDLIDWLVAFGWCQVALPCGYETESWVCGARRLSGVTGISGREVAVRRRWPFPHWFLATWCFTGLSLG